MDKIITWLVCISLMALSGGVGMIKGYDKAGQEFDGVLTSLQEQNEESLLGYQNSLEEAQKQLAGVPTETPFCLGKPRPCKIVVKEGITCAVWISTDGRFVKSYCGVVTRAPEVLVPLRDKTIET